jgi:hypothetical protein
LCKKCSVGVKPCTDRQKLLCEKMEEGFYYFYKFDLFIKLKIEKVVYLGEETKILFKGKNGHLNIWLDSQIKKISRPGNIIQKFDWCYILKDSEGEILGYIGRPQI